MAYRRKIYSKPLPIYSIAKTLQKSTMVALACASKHNKHKQSSVIYTHKQQMINSLTSHPSSHPSALGSNSLSKPSQTSQTQQKMVATVTSFCSLSLILGWKCPQVCGFGNIEGWEFLGYCSFCVLELCCVSYEMNGQLREQPLKVNWFWIFQVLVGQLEKKALFMDVCEEGEVEVLSLASLCKKKITPIILIGC